ncbi:hypothetical protein [Robinsoniella peoriensis]|uniref:Uncharacterized protein n=1 Tax=Robinsoniella peoriensis TaxID=180332 RepID=A0A4U8Q2K0_9FIRM|nr:hypothetical protein [Robinsoniella peoriensis]TLC98964.1 hypothetical protein DSM106044_04294 [Robinsoniella peoriensis]
MDQNANEVYLQKFNQQLHMLGRITLGVAIVLLIGAPLLMGLLYGVMPDMSGFLKGIIKVGIIYIPVAIVEFLVYAPMLGTGGSYLTFLTGNVTNLKIPCAMNSRDIAKTEVGTVENEIISTISISVSALVTMLVIFVGVLLLVPLTPVLQNPVLTPAFDTVVPALFGALGLKYFIKSLKIAFIPLLTMTLLCVIVPAAIPQTSLLLIPAGGMALGIGYLLYRKNML